MHITTELWTRLLLNLHPADIKAQRIHATHNYYKKKIYIIMWYPASLLSCNFLQMARWSLVSVADGRVTARNRATPDLTKLNRMQIETDKNFLNFSFRPEPCQRGPIKRRRSPRQNQNTICIFLCRAEERQRANFGGGFRVKNGQRDLVINPEKQKLWLGGIMARDYREVRGG